MNATMSRRLAAAAVLLAVPTLSSCHVNFGAQTDQIYTPTVGVNDRDGMVDVLHAVIVTDGSGSGRVIAGLANKDTADADELVEVTGAGDDAVTVQLGDGATEIPPSGFLQLADAAFVSIEGEDVQPGRFVRLTFSFANAESATLNVPVMPNTGSFAEVDLSGGTGGENPVSGEGTGNAGDEDDDAVTENEGSTEDEGTE